MVSGVLTLVRMFHSFEGDLEAMPEFRTVSRPSMVVDQEAWPEAEWHLLRHLRQLFHAEQFRSAAEHVCPGKPVTDPFQLSIILQIPGQEVPAHYDVPWFHGATRFTLPQWLLVVMDRSGLFSEKRVDQVCSKPRRRASHYCDS
jgi:hypothetical protein